MLLVILIFIVVNLIVVNECWKNTIKDNNRYQGGRWSTGELVFRTFRDGSVLIAAWNAIIVVAVGCFIMTSYTSYVNARTFYDATLEQYESAITIYEGKAELHVERAFTDLKYQGYQESMTKFITDLREKVVEYNKNIISKRIMKKNPFFSWLIVAPDDYMKVVRLLDNDKQGGERGKI